MRNIAAIILVLVPALALPAVSYAEQAFEVAPFAGHRYGGSFVDANTAASLELTDTAGYGLLLDFDSEPHKQIEILLSRQNTQLSTAGTFTGNPLFDLTIDYYHLGGLYMLPEGGEYLHPFVSGTIGLTRMAPKRSDLTTENHLSISIGGGTKIFLNRSVGLRFDVRGIYTMLNADTAVFCSGGCTIKVRSNGFFQTEIGAALIMRF